MKSSFLIHAKLLKIHTAESRQPTLTIWPWVHIEGNERVPLVRHNGVRQTNCEAVRSDCSDCSVCCHCSPLVNPRREQMLASRSRRSEGRARHVVRSGLHRQRQGTVRSGQVRSGRVRSGQIRSDQISPDQVRSCQIRSDQIRSDKLRSGQVRSGQVSSAQTTTEMYPTPSGALCHF